MDIQLWSLQALTCFVVIGRQVQTTSVSMEGREGQCNGEERGDVESPTGHSATVDEISVAPTWTNGQCVAFVSTSSVFVPTFDLADCRTLLETKGFQIPLEDFEGPLHSALDHPSVRRYLLFNSSCFNCIMAALLYLVVWCALFSTIHMYLREETTDLLVLSLSVSLVSVILTSTIILIFHYNNKEINMNTDVRLVAVNERLVRHRLLLGVADWMQKCRGKLKLFCVYWDLSPCLRSLTEALEEMSFVRDQEQNRLKTRMSHLVLVTEVKTLEPEGGLQDEGVTEEERPLLVDRSEQSASKTQRDDSKLTKNVSLMPDTTLSHQVMAHQLLMSYSALYVRLLVSNKLPTSSQLPLGAGKNHSASSLCLCEYVALKVLQ